MESRHGWLYSGSTWLAMTICSADDVSDGLGQFGSSVKEDVRGRLASKLRTFCVAEEKTDP